MLNVWRFCSAAFLVLCAGCAPMRGATATAQASSMAYDECIARGYAQVKSYPPRCITPQGQVIIKPTPAGVTPTNGCENKCGDGVCQQIVCQALGCPCAETPVNCPNDCANAAY